MKSVAPLTRVAACILIFGTCWHVCTYCLDLSSLSRYSDLPSDQAMHAYDVQLVCGMCPHTHVAYQHLTLVVIWQWQSPGFRGPRCLLFSFSKCLLGSELGRVKKHFQVGNKKTFPPQVVSWLQWKIPCDPLSNLHWSIGISDAWVAPTNEFFCWVL